MSDIIERDVVVENENYLMRKSPVIDGGVIEYKIRNPSKEVEIENDSVILDDSTKEQLQTYEGYLIPKDYEFRGNEIWKIIQKPTKDGIIDKSYPICSINIIPAGRYDSKDDGVSYIELKVRDRCKEFKTITVAQHECITVKGVQECLIKEKNLFILGDKAGEVAKYIYETINVNEDNYSPKFVHGESYISTGWKGRDFKTFVFGNEALYDVNGRTEVKEVVFADTRDINIDIKMKPRGSLKSYLNAIQDMLKYPIFLFKLCYDASTILLGPLNVPNSSFNITEDSSKGKTFTLQLSAAMFGNPDEKVGLIINGKTSVAGVVPVMVTLVDIPTPIDEVTYMEPKVRRDVPYMIGNGQEPARGTGDGKQRKLGKIRTNATTTGEMELEDEFTHNGAYARSFTNQRMRPIPRMNPVRIDEIRDAVLANYGHVGRLLVSKFFANRNETAKRYNDAYIRLSSRTDDDIAKRQARYFAVTEAGGFLLEKVFEDNGIKLTTNITNLINDMFDKFVLNSPNVPSQQKMLSAVYRWCKANPQYFLLDDQIIPDNVSSKAFSKTYYGYYVQEKDMSKNPIPNTLEYIDITVNGLQAIFEQLKHDGSEISRSVIWWREHGFTACNEKKEGAKGSIPNTKKVSHFGTAGSHKRDAPAPVYRLIVDKIHSLDDYECEEEINNNIPEYSSEYINGSFDQPPMDPAWWAGQKAI